MPSALPHDDDDPVVASYDVYITNPLSKGATNTSEPTDISKLFVLQYSSHRSSSKPYNTARSQKPTCLRIKHQTGMVELEVPIITEVNFNKLAGNKYGQALAESRISSLGGTHGLVGGFPSNTMSAQNINLGDIPAYGEQRNRVMETQTLGGKIADACDRDPVYMLGSFTNKKLHLTHLDAVIQMRPQLHHIDAEEEINQKNFQASSASSSKVKMGFEGPPPKLESRAIEIKLKDSKEDPKDRNLNVNAKLLRDVQADQWNLHEWIDEDDQESWFKAAAATTLRSVVENSNTFSQLKSVIMNDDWMDKMSVPREDGKKGLRAKLKGRDRERARRKKVDNQKRRTNADTTATVPRAEGSSDSDLSSASDHSDVEMVAQGAGLNDPDTKQEQRHPPAAPVNAPSAPATVSPSNPPKKRGRPKKA